MHEHGQNSPADGTLRRLTIVGNPNVGKSAVFGLLTGTYVTVSNYPGTTVEVTSGTGFISGEKWNVNDTPGVNTLAPTSEDERVTRDILLKERNDVVLQVLDSKNLRRALLITLQLLEMGFPLVLALNMADEAAERGIEIDAGRLTALLGVEAVPTVATMGRGFSLLKKAITAAHPGDFSADYGPVIENGVRRIEALLPGNSTFSRRALALAILSEGDTLEKWTRSHYGPETSREIGAVRQKVQESFDEPVSQVIARARMKRVEEIAHDVTSRKEGRSSWMREALGRVTMHPLYGIPVLAAVLLGMYEFVGVFGAQTCVDFFQKTLFGKFINPVSVRLVDSVLPFPFFQRMLVGEYGIMTMALTYSLAIILPIVGTFFIAFGLLEDSGYLPRLAVMVNKIFRMMGLNGKAVLPMILGLGCDTMATLTARILDTRKERVIVTLLLALGVPCSAQLGVILGMLGGLSFLAALWWGGVVVAILLLVGYLSSRIFSGDTSFLLMEIPPLRRPRLSNIGKKTLARMQWYLKEAVPLFILGTLLLFVLHETGALELLERAAAPIVVNFLHLPPRATEAFIIGFLRRDYGAAGLFTLEKQGLLDPIQVVVSLVTITLFVPCVANFFIMIKERGLKMALGMTAFIFPFAFLVGGAINWVMRALHVTL